MPVIGVGFATGAERLWPEVKKDEEVDEMARTFVFAACIGCHIPSICGCTAAASDCGSGVLHRRGSAALRPRGRRLGGCRPGCTIRLGRHALFHLTGKDGINKWRGSILPSVHGGYKVVGTIHPASLFKRTTKYSQKAIIQADYCRAVEESKSPELNLPNRTLQVIKSSYELQNFLNYYFPKYRRIMVDLEVMKAIPTCFGIAFNKNHGVSIPLIPLSHLRGAVLMSDAERREMLHILARFIEDERLEVCGQNFKFDHQKILNPLRMRLRNENVYYDSMLAQHVLNPEFPKKLEFISSIETREPFYKDEGR